MPLEIVNQLLAASGFVMAYVDARQNMTAIERISKPFTQHYVMIYGKDERGYEIFDPYMGDFAYLCPRYGQDAGFAIGGVIKLNKVAPIEPPAMPPGAAAHDAAKIAEIDRSGLLDWRWA